MTDQHPLTDETCEDLSSCITILTAPGDPDPYICPQYIADDMRAAADWQLKKVIQAWEQCIEEPGTDIQLVRHFDQKLKAMRPTTTQEESDD